jgi:hypothetical protein
MCFPSPTTTSDNHWGNKGRVLSMDPEVAALLTRQLDGTPLASCASGNIIHVHRWQALALVQD